MSPGAIPSGICVSSVEAMCSLERAAQGSSLFSISIRQGRFVADILSPALPEVQHEAEVPSFCATRGVGGQRRTTPLDYRVCARIRRAFWHLDLEPSAVTVYKYTCVLLYLMLRTSFQFTHGDDTVTRAGRAALAGVSAQQSYSARALSGGLANSLRDLCQRGSALCRQ